MATEILVKGVPSRALPQPQADNQREGVATRLSRYGGPLAENVIIGKQALADEGSYFVAVDNGTIGTGLAYAIQASFSDTVAAFVWFNNDQSLSGVSKTIYLDYIKLVTTVAPASGAAFRYAIKLDNANRIPTAGQVLLTPSTIGPTAGSSISKFWGFTAAALTVPASSGNAKTVAKGGIGANPTLNGEYLIRFGANDSTTGLAIGGTSQAGPIGIPAGWYAVVYIWFPSNATTAGTFEYDCGWWER
jgi:hypothetical protein